MPSYPRWAAAGAALGLCGLCRPELLLWAAACVPALFLPWGATGRFLSGAARCSVLIAAALLVLAPWVVRNQIEFGRPIVTTTHGGYTLLLANNPSFHEYLREGKRGTVWDARGLGPEWAGEARHDSPADELAADGRAYDEAWTNIGRQPAAFAHACLVRVGRFWALAPHQGTPAARRAIGISYLVELALAAVGLWIGLGAGPGRAAGLWLWGLLLAVSMTGVHAVYWSNMRMRAALVPMIALAAAAAIAWWAGRARSTQVSAEQGLKQQTPPTNPP